MQIPFTKSIVPIVALVAWTTFLACAMISLVIYPSQPGRAANAPWIFPETVTVFPRIPKPVLVVFLHPHCPCSGSTLEKIQSIMERSSSEIDCRVYVVIPPEAPEGWEDGHINNRLRDLKNATVEIDRNGSIASQFSASTSGQVLLYRDDGVLAFSGGITSNQSHAGRCLGLLALDERLQTKDLPFAQSPVFGCPLFNSEANCRAEAPCLQK